MVAAITRTSTRMSHVARPVVTLKNIKGIAVQRFRLHIQCVPGHSLRPFGHLVGVGAGSTASVADSVTSTELKNVPDVGLAKTTGAVTSIVMR